jgi:hypothetical protein
MEERSAHGTLHGGAGFRPQQEKAGDSLRATPASCLDLALVGSYGQPETSYDALLVSEQLDSQQVQ